MTAVTADAAPPARPAPVTLGQAFWVWLRIALLSFGGPAGQIAVMHRILVDEKRWIGEQRFLHALNYCMLLPGPEAQQLATYIGWLMHRTKGGIVAGVLFVIPGAVAIMALSWVYVLYGRVGIVSALFFGLKCAVLAVVLQAVVRIGGRALTTTPGRALAMLAFVLIFCASAVKQPAMVALLGRLETMELIARTPHESDRRSAMIALTERGQAIAAIGREVLLGKNARALRGFSALETDILVALLHRLIANLEADEQAAAEVA